MSGIRSLCLEQGGRGLPRKSHPIGVAGVDGRFLAATLPTKQRFKLRVGRSIVGSSSCTALSESVCRTRDAGLSDKLPETSSRTTPFSSAGRSRQR